MAESEDSEDSEEVEGGLTTAVWACSFAFAFASDRAVSSCGLEDFVSVSSAGFVGSAGAVLHTGPSSSNILEEGVV